MKNNPVNRFQRVLGIVVLAAVGLLAWSHLGGLTIEERTVRAKEQASELAKAALDYRSDTGQWPLNHEGEADLTPLLGNRSNRARIARADAPGGGLNGWENSNPPGDHPGTPKFWVRDLPLDPWGRPYRVVATDEAIAVLSDGPDGEPDTDPARIWVRPDHINPCDGDDIGFVLAVDQYGGVR